MNTNEDRRVKLTKRLLRESLLDLLKIKGLNEISVTELCKAADINRNTFYNHYTIPADIVKELETEIYQTVMQEAMKSTNAEDIILIACQTLEQNRKMSEVVFSNTNLEGLFQMIQLSLSSLSAVEQLNDAETTDSYSENHFIAVYREKGCIAIIKEWVVTGFKIAPEKITALIYKLITQEVK